MKVVIFGAGAYGRTYALDYLQKGHEILYFVDNDPKKHGLTISLEPQANNIGGGGKKMTCLIKSPEVLLESEFDKIIIGTHTGYHEVSEQLHRLSIPYEKIDSSFTMHNAWARETFLQCFAKIAHSKNLIGSVAEVGVYRGDFARHINALFPEKTLYLFDTFEGFAEQDIAQDTITSQELGNEHFSNTSVELVLSRMPNPNTCVIKKGWFPESATGLEGERFCFVSLDTDLYAPILAGLEFFYPKLVVGGIILIDDYFLPEYEGVKKAVNSFCVAHGISFAPIGDGKGVIILKEGL